MADQSNIVNSNPIGEGLRDTLESINVLCKNRGIIPSPDAWNQLGMKHLKAITSILIDDLLQLTAAHNLRSKYDSDTLHDDLLELDSSKETDRFHALLNAILAKKPDKEIWDAVYDAVPEKKPPSTRLRHPQVASLAEQTPHSRNARGVVNSSEYRSDIDPLLKEELAYMYAGIPDFFKTYFGRVAGLDAAHESVFRKCMEGKKPLFENGYGWHGWPKQPDQHKVLHWFAGLVKQLSKFAEEYEPTPMNRWSLETRPDQPVRGGSPADRKPDVCFIKPGPDSQYTWSQVVIPGELKSNPDADRAKSTWLDIGRYAREVLIGQDTRRFVLSFTLCGSLMRVWVFDRLGAIASDAFDINDDGQQFVYIVLGFLWMNQEDLGFDPTVIEKDGQRLITITRNNATEQFVIDKLMLRTSCIVGRATTCWMTHAVDDPQTFFVIKDSWQEEQRREEGELLRIATEKRVSNVARYYHHENVVVRGQVDSVRDNVRGKLNISGAALYLEPHISPTTKEFNTRLKSQTSKTGQISNATSQTRTSNATSQTGNAISNATSNATSQTSNASNRKRASGQTGAPLPSGKRHCGEPKSRTKAGSIALSNQANRIHRRVVLCDYGKPIYKASSRVALLKALEGCINGHESLKRAKILHRDISINNLMINEDVINNPSPFSFLIDLDLAIIVEDSRKASGARTKTGTRVFMSIGALKGHLHSFMDDLESFFWVLFWICINYAAGGEMVKSNPLDNWNYKNDRDLIDAKTGVINEEAAFMEMAEHFTRYYRPLIRWVDELRKVVFPDNKRWEEEDPALYSRMKAVLQEAQKDPEVLKEDLEVLAKD
ncbi:hypothetical protein F4679DRAFT_103240 [Xylaria curta]|nr:hypothetical protein F4679DRAFT_103240 [Xylaria curta]